MKNENINDIILCANSIEYFSKQLNLYGDKIEKLTDFQKELFEDLDNETKIVKNVKRQVGKTTAASIYMLYNSIFSEFKTSCIFTYSNIISKEILNTICNLYNSLPEHLKFTKISKKNSNSIEFDNGSYIFIGSNNNYRGRTLNLVYFDEYSHIKNAREILKNIYPNITSNYGSKILALSTDDFMDMLR